MFIIVQKSSGNNANVPEYGEGHFLTVENMPWYLFKACTFYNGYFFGHVLKSRKFACDKINKKSKLSYVLHNFKAIKSNIS